MKHITARHTLLPQLEIEKFNCISRLHTSPMASRGATAVLDRQAGFGLRAPRYRQQIGPAVFLPVDLADRSLRMVVIPAPLRACKCIDEDVFAVVALTPTEFEWSSFHLVTLPKPRPHARPRTESLREAYTRSRTG